MAGTLTSRTGLYKPASDGSDNVNVVTDLNNNLDRLDTYLGVLAVTSSTRPASAFSGQMIRETDTGRIYINSGAIPASAGWTIQVVGGSGTFTGDISLTGSVMAGSFLRSTRTSTAQGFFSGRLNAEVNDRLTIFGDGKLSWGVGASAQDTNLYRSAAALLKTDGSMEVGAGLNVLGNLTLSGSASIAGALTGNLSVTGNLAAAGVGGVRTAFRSTDSAAVTNSTAVNDTQLFAAVEANATYIVEMYLRWTCTSNTPGFKIQFTGPSGATMTRSFFAQPTANTTATGTMDTGTQTTIGNPDTRQSINGTVGGMVKGLLTVGANAGTLTLQWAQNTTNAAGIVLNQGSWMKLTRVG